MQTKQNHVLTTPMHQPQFKKTLLESKSGRIEEKKRIFMYSLPQCIYLIDVEILLNECSNLG